jgi:hypothetical protein
VTEDEPDYYTILGVAPSATQDEIKAAYRRETRHWHPDANPDPRAEERFKLIGLAYEALGDPGRREAYDAARSPRLVFAPSLIDFGDVRPGDPPKRVTVQLRNEGGLLQADELNKYTEPSEGPFWSISYANEDLDEENRDPQLIYEFIFESEADPDLPPERYTGAVRCFIGGNFAELHIRTTVLAGPTTTMPGEPEPWDTDPIPPSSAVADPVFTGPTPRARNPTALVAGALVVILIAVIATLIGVHAAGHHSATSSQSGSPGTTVSSGSSGATDRNTSGLLNVSSSEDLIDGANILVGRGDVLDISNMLTLMNPDGTAAWSNSPAISELETDTTSSENAPQASNQCAIATDDVRDAEFISLQSGAQRTTAGYGVLSGNRAAWSDGTIRDACTGTVLGRAAPSNDFNTAECLTGSIIIGTNGGGLPLMAWQSGHKLWQKSEDYSVVCDSQGSAMLVNGINYTISLVDPSTGGAYWTVKDPTCASSDYSDCITNPTAGLHLLETPQQILLSTFDAVLAFDKQTGQLLWRKTSGCLLAARTSPQPEALLGPCTGEVSTNVGGASVVDAATGTAIQTFAAGNYDQWSATSKQVLSVDSNTGAAQVRDW